MTKEFAHNDEYINLTYDSFIQDMEYDLPKDRTIFLKWEFNENYWLAEWNIWTITYEMIEDSLRILKLIKNKMNEN